MSMLLMVKVMGMKIGSPSRKLIMLKLADNANDDGRCFPSYQNIADHCEMSKRAIINHIKQLEASGFLQIKSRKTPKGYSSNNYLLTLSDGEISAPPPSEISAPPPSEISAPPLVKYLHPPSEISAPPPSEISAPRTSHSFEPVNEPVKTSKKTEFESGVVGIPANLNLQAWHEFEQHRKSMKPALTDLARKKLIKKITALSLDQQQQCIDLTIENGWKGLFPEKQSNGESNGSHGKQRVSAQSNNAATRVHERNKQLYAEAVAREQGDKAVH